MQKIMIFINSKTLLLSVLLNLLLSSAASAQPVSGAVPDIGAGKKRAAVCFACHGPDGIAKIPGVPHLAGQDRSYLEKALRAYRDAQQRQEPTMTAMAKPLSDTDISNIAAYFSLQTWMNNGQTAAQTLETIERIRPVANLSVAAGLPPPAGQTVRSGEAIYQASCNACHGAGVLGAPKFGDKAGWASRISQGNSVLLQHAMQGYKAMPAKGNCVDCSESEIKLALEYLITKAK